MHRYCRVLVCALFVLYNPQLTLGTSHVGLNVIEGGVGGIGLFGDYDATGKYFEIGSNIDYSVNRCTHTITVSGNGVLDNFDLPCGSSNEVTSLGTDKFVVYRNPQENLIFFTNTPSTLILVDGDKCTRRIYKTNNEITTYQTIILNIDQCRKAMIAMEVAKKEWQKEFEAKMGKIFPPIFPVHNSGYADDGLSQQGILQNQHDSKWNDAVDDWNF